MTTPAKPLDLVLFGATGFTGRLVAEVLHATLSQSTSAGADPTTTGAGAHPAEAAPRLRWGLAGRDLGRLAEVRDALGAPAQLPLLQVDAADAGALSDLVRQTRLVISTVGPYQHLGEPLVTACAHAGTDYLDLCGEPVWMARMVQRLQTPAKASGARIVFSCGFDSIPFDLGVVHLQFEAMQRLGAPLACVHARVEAMKGGFSGGTVASLLATLEAADHDPAQARVMDDPFALTPGFSGPPQPGQTAQADHDDVTGGWSAPFVMAAINTKNVHRTNALRGHPWGRDFCYDERLWAGSGPWGHARALMLSGSHWLQTAALAWPTSRQLLRNLLLPQPGEGPSEAQRESGHYAVRFVGASANGRHLASRVRGQGDPGYGSTSRLLSHSALCLLQDVDARQTPGGVWTPGAAMGLALVRRLTAHAGLSFELLDDDATTA